MFNCGVETIEESPVEICNNEEMEPNKINVQIFNLSSFDITNFNYDNKHTFDLLRTGDTSCYIQLDNSWNAPFYQELTINGEEKALHRIDPLGLNQLVPGHYTYLFHAFQYGEGEITFGGKIYDREIIRDFDPVNQNCIELTKSECNPQPNKINIRIKNSTAFDFCNLKLKVTSDNHEVLGNIKAGETTCYLSFDEAKVYPFLCNFILGNNEYIIENPTYHDNLELLPPGNYTYNVYLIRPDTKFAGITMSND